MKSGSKIGRLRDALVLLHGLHQWAGTLPTSARFLFYELVSRSVISKHATGARRADQDMNDALVSLRERGAIPWEDIVDETRFVESFTGWQSIRECVESALERTELDPWSVQVPFVVTESRSLAGVLRPVVAQYRVRIASTNGQCGGFLHNEIVPLLYCGARILYFGDADFSGGHIEQNSRRVLEQIVGPLQWERLALTEAQVEEYKLPVIRKFDKRDKRHHDAVETEALSQGVIVEILRSRLDALLPQALARVHARERRQRREMSALLHRNKKRLSRCGS